MVGIQYVEEVIEEGRHGRRGALRGITISERWKREKCQKVERTVNGNTGPACPVISADSLRTALFPEASASPCRQYKTSSLWPLHLTDAISHTGSETTRLQSHHCCEGNCSSLSHKSAPPCALQAKTYIYTTSKQHTHTQTGRDKCTQNSFVTLAEQKSPPTEFVAVLLFISLSLCSWLLDLH